MGRFHLPVAIHTVRLSAAALREERYLTQSGNATGRINRTTKADMGTAELASVCQAKAFVQSNRGAAQLYPVPSAGSGLAAKQVNAQTDAGNHEHDQTSEAQDGCEPGT